MPEKLSVSNATAIKGKKTLMIHCEANPDTKHWDEVILLSISAPVTDQTTDVKAIEQTSPATSDRQLPSPCRRNNRCDARGSFLVFITIAARSSVAK